VLENGYALDHWAGAPGTMPSKMIQESGQFLMEVLKVLVLSDSITSLWLASFGLLACLDFGPCPLFLFLSLSLVLSFDKVWQGFIIMLHDKDNTILC
jgi:hypothetical protein